MGDLSKNFSAWEFACKCGCGTGAMDPTFIDRLQFMRQYMGRSISIRSGIRCPEHNAKVGGKPDSEHIPDPITGLVHGADLGYSGSTQRRAWNIGAHAAFARVGIAESFFHVGNRASKAQGVTWIYPKKGTK
jgi:hypothetical protein